MNKYIYWASFGIILIIMVGLSVVSGRQNAQNNSQSTLGFESFVQCLAEQEVVVYGSETCPACFQFAEQFGGYEEIDPIFIECGDNPQECAARMQTNYVPEIQIGGELFEGISTPEGLSDITGCKIDNSEL